MRKITLAFVLSMLSLLSVSSNAAEQKGGVCIGTNDIGASSSFNCEHIGSVTIKQIYEKGFRVIAYHHDPKNSGVVSLIIEEQKKNS